MIKLHKKMLSIMLVISMIITALPSFAAGDDTSEQAQTVSPDADKDKALFVEAEDCILSKAGSYEIVKDKKDSTISGGKYIVSTGSKLSEPDGTEPEMTYALTVEQNATYYVWMRYSASSNGCDSFFIGFNDQSLNNAYGKSVDITGSDWRWKMVCSAPLSTGKNTLKMYHREAGLKHDAFYITTDSAFIPSEHQLYLEAYNKAQAEKRESFIIEPIEPINTFGENGTMFEAESTGSKGVVIKKDTSASGGKYMLLRESGSNVENPINFGQPSAVFSLDVPYEALYYVWARLKAPSEGADSFWINMDTFEHRRANVYITDDYYWARIYSQNLTQGIHTLNLIPRESGTMFDKFIITSNAAYTPSGEGDISKISYDIRYPEPTITPPPSHPRLYFTAEKIPKIIENLTKPQNEGAYNLYRQLVETSLDEVDGKLESNEAGNWVGRYLGIAEAKALEYALFGDEEIGSQAVTILKNYCQTINISKLNYNTAGQLIFTIGEVYDWCYPLLDDSNKSLFHNTVISAGGKLEVKYPPTSQGAITGHGAEGQLMRDLMGAGVAMYDEYPHIYQNTAGRFLTEFIEYRKWKFQGRMDPMGSKYFAYRAPWELLATMIFDAMGYPNIFGDEFDDTIRYYFYPRRGDGYILADGDGSYHNNEIGYYYKGYARVMFLAGNYFKDPMMKWEAMREIENLTPWEIDTNQQLGPVEFLLFNDPDLDGKPYTSLPLTHYQPSPKGGMIARTGWSDGFDSPDVVCEMKINEYTLNNHQHLDAGAFQIYYKGALATDDGYYQAYRGGGDGNTEYGSEHFNNYYRRTIAHNSILVYDPDEVFPDFGGNSANDGGQYPPNEWAEAKTFEVLMNPDNGYKVGEILAHEYGTDPIKPNYSYLKGDISKAYSDKVENFERSFMFLNLKNEAHPAALVVFDRVISSNPSFKKTWLCHGLFEPNINGNHTVFTNARNGVGQDSYNGKLTIDTLLPQKINIETVGGEGHEHEVNGVNYLGKWLDGKRNEGHGYRIEISPAQSNKKDYFLNVLQMNDADGEDALAVTLIENDKIAGAVVADRVVIFGKERDRSADALTFAFSGEGEYEITVADLAAGTWSVKKDGEQLLDTIVTAEGGVAVFRGGSGEYTLSRTGENAVREVVEPEPIEESEVILIRVNGRLIYSDVAPVIIDDRTLVPMRVIFEKLGVDVSWDEASATATAVKDGREVKITEDSTTAYIDGGAVELDVPAMILNGRFVVPVRFVSEAFGANVSWNQWGKIVSVTQ